MTNHAMAATEAGTSAAELAAPAEATAASAPESGLIETPQVGKFRRWAGGTALALSSIGLAATVVAAGSSEKFTEDPSGTVVEWVSDLNADIILTEGEGPTQRIEINLENLFVQEGASQDTATDSAVESSESEDRDDTSSGNEAEASANNGSGEEAIGDTPAVAAGDTVYEAFEEVFGEKTPEVLRDAVDAFNVDPENSLSAKWIGTEPKEQWILITDQDGKSFPGASAVDIVQGLWPYVDFDQAMGQEPDGETSDEKSDTKVELEGVAYTLADDPVEQIFVVDGSEPPRQDGYLTVYTDRTPYEALADAGPTLVTENGTTVAKTVDSETVMPALRAAAAACEADPSNDGCTEVAWHGTEDTEMVLKLTDASGVGHWETAYIMRMLAPFLEQQGILGFDDESDDGKEEAADSSRPARGGYVLAA